MVDMSKRILRKIYQIGLCFSVVLSLFGCSSMKEITFTSQDDVVTVDDEINLKYVTVPTDADTDEISVLFSDDSFIRTDEEHVFAVKEGTVTASLVYKDEVYDTKTIEIRPVLCKEIYVTDKDLGVGREETVEVQFFPENCTHRDYVLKSEDESVVKTFGNKIIAVSEGETGITVESVDGVRTSFNVSVHPVEAEHIVMSGLKDTYVVGESDTVNVVFIPTDVTYPNVTFSSSNRDILSIDENGTVKAKYPGEVTVTAVYSDNVTDTRTIKVKYPSVSSISASVFSNTIYVGNKTSVSVGYEPQRVDDYTVHFSSSNEKVATVDEKGTVIGIAAGTATITAKTANGKTSKVDITVKEQAVITNTTRSNTGGSESAVSSGSSSGTMVWIPKTGSKYHYRSSCSNMKNPTQVTLEEAIRRGYEPCKKCAGG